MTLIKAVLLFSITYSKTLFQFVWRGFEQVIQVRNQIIIQGRGVSLE